MAAKGRCNSPERCRTEVRFRREAAVCHRIRGRPQSGTERKLMYVLGSFRFCPFAVIPGGARRSVSIRMVDRVEAQENARFTCVR